MPTRILLIEDNPDHALLTKRILTDAEEDYQVDYVDDAKEGLSRIFQQDYDLVLSDYRMPGLSALEILRQVKEKGKDLPFVVITASGNEKAAVDLMKEGAYDYIVKDVSYDDTLPMVIKKSIERYNEIRERKKAQEELLLKTSLLEAQSETSIDGILAVDSGRKSILFNKRFGQMWNIPWQILDTRDDEKMLQYVSGQLKNPEEFLERVRYLYAHKDEKSSDEVEFKDGKFFDRYSSPLIDSNGKYYGRIWYFRDVTEHKRAEQALRDAYQKLKETQEQLIQSGKMAAMGQLAAGISHELNQPLTGIKGFVQAILMDLDESRSSPIREDLVKIEQQAERMDRIIKNIRLFAQKAKFKLEPMDINQPIEDSFMLLNQQLKLHNIKVEKYLKPDLPKIKGDTNQLQQVFLNLITNARDAIDALNGDSGGAITVTTDLDKNRQNIIIKFSDTGCGIKKEELTNVFNPFYTTKSPGGGIGLGLSICYRIIQDHKATIEVNSKLDRGATFTLTFPVIRTESKKEI